MIFPSGDQEGKKHCALLVSLVINPGTIVAEAGYAVERLTGWSSCEPHPDVSSRLMMPTNAAIHCRILFLCILMFIGSPHG